VERKKSCDKSGLVLRGETWHIQKTIAGCRLRESTGASSREEAERYLAKRILETREVKIFGARQGHTFIEAAAKYLEEGTKASLIDDEIQIGHLLPFIGDLSLDRIHQGTLGRFITHRKNQGVKNRTVNYGIQTVRRILGLAANEWVDENDQTWLAQVPRFRFLPETDRRSPYPLSYEEQDRLFSELPSYLANAALFKVNTGCRNAEVCSLRWEWEEFIPALNASIFLLPREIVKNREDRVVVLNSEARRAVEVARGQHPEVVFVKTDGSPLYSLYGTVWKKARQRAGLPQVRVHDLKHTFGRRLRAAGVSFQDAQDLLGHKSRRMTTHYSRPEILQLIQAAELVCQPDRRGQESLVILRGYKNLRLINE
jgi:integrase